MNLRDTFEGKHLLVTGVTGFVGKVWLAMLLDFLPDVRKVSLVVRPQKGRSAEDRFEEIYRQNPAFRALRERHGTALYDLVDDKVAVVSGELTERVLGLSTDEAKELMRDVDVVVHFAGLTDFEPDPVPAIRANIEGAQFVAELASLGPSRRYVHCSTTYVAGRADGRVAETLTPGVTPLGHEFDVQQEFSELKQGLRFLESKRDRIDYAMARAQQLGWPNIYTYTKGLAEHLIGQRTDVATTTVRPAIVECARHYPFAGWNEGVNTSGPIVWLLSTSFRRFPSCASNRFDVVPVDSVARGCMVAIAEALRDESRGIYNVASSDLNALTFGRAIELVGLGEKRRHRASGTLFDRLVLQHLDSVAVDADRPQLLGVDQLSAGAAELRKWLRRLDLEQSLSPRMYRRWGNRLESKRRSWIKSLRSNESKLSAVSGMLRQYRPFIFDHDYAFVADNVMAASARLSGDEATLFRFDVGDIDWRRYWLQVQVPGLERWSIPILRGEKVDMDPPLAARPAKQRPIASQLPSRQARL